MSVFILTISELEANLENQCMASVLYAHGEGGWKGVERERGEVVNHVTALIWL